MRKLLMILLAIFLLTTEIEASEILEHQAQQFGVGELEENLPDEASVYIKDFDPQGADLFGSAQEILSDSLSESGGYLKTSVTLFLKLLLILVLCRLVESGEQFRAGQAAVMAGVLALTLCCASDLRTMIGLGKQTMYELMDFSRLLLPVMASAAASGFTSGAGVLYGIAAVFSDLLVAFCVKFLIPAVYACLALGVADGALGESRLSKLRKLLEWAVRWVLKGMMYLFTGFITVSGIISGNVDAMALKAAKVTISGVVPVVGGIISEAAETVLYGAGMLKGAVGTYGMLAFLAVFTAPFVQMGIHYLGFKLTAALGGVMGSSLCEFMECICGVMGLLLAMLGSCVLMCLVSCCCFMGVVGV